MEEVQTSKKWNFPLFSGLWKTGKKRVRHVEKGGSLLSLAYVQFFLSVSGNSGSEANVHDSSIVWDKQFLSLRAAQSF